MTKTEKGVEPDVPAAPLDHKVAEPDQRGQQGRAPHHQHLHDTAGKHNAKQHGRIQSPFRKGASRSR